MRGAGRAKESASSSYCPPGRGQRREESRRNESRRDNRCRDDSRRAQSRGNQPEDPCQEPGPSTNRWLARGPPVPGRYFRMMMKQQANQDANIPPKPGEPQFDIPVRIPKRFIPPPTPPPRTPSPRPVSPPFQIKIHTPPKDCWGVRHAPTPTPPPVPHSNLLVQSPPGAYRSPIRPRVATPCPILGDPIQRPLPREVQQNPENWIRARPIRIIDNTRRRIQYDADMPEFPKRGYAEEEGIPVFSPVDREGRFFRYDEDESPEVARFPEPGIEECSSSTDGEGGEAGGMADGAPGDPCPEVEDDGSPILGGIMPGTSSPYGAGAGGQQSYDFGEDISPIFPPQPRAGPSREAQPRGDLFDKKCGCCRCSDEPTCSRYGSYIPAFNCGCIDVRGRVQKEWYAHERAMDIQKRIEKENRFFSRVTDQHFQPLMDSNLGPKPEFEDDPGSTDSEGDVMRHCATPSYAMESMESRYQTPRCSPSPGMPEIPSVPDPSRSLPGEHMSRSDERRRPASSGSGSRRKRKNKCPREVSSQEQGEEEEMDFEPSLKKPHPNACDRCWRYASPSRSPVNKPNQRYDPNYRRSHSLLNMRSDSGEGETSPSGGDGCDDDDGGNGDDDDEDEEVPAETKVRELQRSNDRCDPNTNWGSERRSGGGRPPTSPQQKTSSKTKGPPKANEGKAPEADSAPASDRPRSRICPPKKAEASSRSEVCPEPRGREKKAVQSSPAMLREGENGVECVEPERGKGRSQEKDRPQSAYPSTSGAGRSRNTGHSSPQSRSIDRRRCSFPEISSMHPESSQMRQPQIDPAMAANPDNCLRRLSGMNGTSAPSSGGQGSWATKQKRASPGPTGKKGNCGEGGCICNPPIEPKGIICPNSGPVKRVCMCGKQSSGQRKSPCGGSRSSRRRGSAPLDGAETGTQSQAQNKTWPGADIPKIRVEDADGNERGGSFSRQCSPADPSSNKGNQLTVPKERRGRGSQKSDACPEEKNPPRKYCVFYMTKGKENEGKKDDVEVLIEELTEGRTGKDERTQALKDKMRKVSEHRLDSMALRFQKGMQDKCRRPQSNRLLYF